MDRFRDMFKLSVCNRCHVGGSECRVERGFCDMVVVEVLSLVKRVLPDLKRMAH